VPFGLSLQGFIAVKSLVGPLFPSLSDLLVSICRVVFPILGRVFRRCCCRGTVASDLFFAFPTRLSLGLCFFPELSRFRRNSCRGKGRFVGAGVLGVFWGFAFFLWGGGV